MIDTAVAPESPANSATRAVPATLLDRQLVSQIGDRAADEQNAAPILRDAARTVSLLDIGLIYGGLNVVAAAWSIGALATTVFGLDLMGALWALLIGNTLAGLALGLASGMGQVRVPQMMLSRYALGMHANIAPALLNFIAAMGWFAVNTVSITLAASSVLPALGIPDNLLTKMIVLGVTTLACLYLAVGNFEKVRRAQRWLVPPLLVSLLPITYFAFADVSWTNLGPATGPAAGGAFNYWTMWLTVIGAVCFGYVATWSVCASDITRFYRFRTPPDTKRVVLVIAAVSVVSTTWLEMIGAALATVVRGVDPAAHTASKGPLLALVALFFLIVGVITTNYINLINGSLTAKAIWRTGSRLAWTSAVAVVGTLLAAYSVFVSDIATTFHSFLVAVFIWEAPWLGILLTDYYLVRRRQYSVPDLYGLTKAIPGWNGAGITAYLAGLLSAATFSFTGKHELFGFPLYSALMPEYFNGGDFSYIAGFLVSSFLYYALARVPKTVVAAHPIGLEIAGSGEVSTQRQAELSRPLITIAVTGVFLLALFALYVALTASVSVAGTVSAELKAAVMAIPAVLVAVLGLTGGLRLPRVVDRVIDLIDDRQLLSETAETFSRAQSLPDLADFLTKHVVYRLELTRAWLILAEGRTVSLARAEKRTAARSNRSAAGALCGCNRPTDPGECNGDVDGHAFGPWVDAGAQVLIPLRVGTGKTGEGELLGIWAVGAPGPVMHWNGAGYA